MSKRNKLIIGVSLAILGLLLVFTGVKQGSDLLEDAGYILFAAGLVFGTLGSNLIKNG